MQKNKAKRDKTIAERQKKEKELVLEKFRRMPIVQIVLEQTSISRSTYYRWRDEDLGFRKAADAALLEGEMFITELSESKLLSLINNEHFPAIHLWLKSHHPKYARRLEISGKVEQPRDELTEEEAAMLTEALRQAGFSLPPDLEINNKTSNKIN